MTEWNLVELVIEQIKEDVENQDFTAIESLLFHVPKDILIGYLPEGTYNA